MIQAESFTTAKRKMSNTKSWTILYCTTMEEVREAIEDKTFVFPQIRRGVQRMLEEERTSWMITEIICLDAGASIWISITLDEAEDSLKLMLKWHVEREEFEECSQISALIEACKSRKSSS